MKKTILYSSVIWCCVCIQPAMAYIDPGSGSAIISAIIGFFVAAGMVTKTYWYKIKSVFTGKKPSVKSEDGDTASGRAKDSSVD